MFELSNNKNLGILSDVKEISPIELNRLFSTNSSFYLVDVREDFEKEMADIGGELIPLGELNNHLNKFNNKQQIIIYCRSGKRSADAIRHLEQKLGLQNLYNLKGGILAWSDEIDSSIQKY